MRTNFVRVPFFLMMFKVLSKQSFFLPSPDFQSFRLSFSLDACQSILALLDVSFLA